MTQWTAASDRGAHDDEHGTEHDGAEDPPEQHPVLVRRGDRKRREEQGEDEDVVDRERELDQVAGEVLAAGGRPAGDRHECAECER